MSPFDMLFNDINIGYLKITGYKFGSGLDGNITVCKLNFIPSEEAIVGDWCNINFTDCTIWNSDLELVPVKIFNSTASIIRDIQLDINQSTFDRGFPIRHTMNGEWVGAQSFIPTLETLCRVDLYLRRFGIPEYDLKVELRENTPEGTLLETISFSHDEVSSTWNWLKIDFTDASLNVDSEYCIVIPFPPERVTTSFGYEWGYSFDNQYDDGLFWFTRDGGSLWRNLPAMYEFAFRTYGY